MARAIVFDVITAYHLFGALSYCVSKGDVSELDVYLIPNLNNEFLAGEGVLVDGDLRINIKHSGSKKKSFLARFLLFTLVRSIRFRATSCCQRLYIGHHTYFKPTILSERFAEPLGTITTFSFEEGIGSYGGYSHHVAAAKREGRNFPRVKYFLRKFLRSKLWLDDSWCLLSEPPLGFESENYIKAIQIISSIKWEGGECFYSVGEDYKKDSVLFFSSPFVELGILTLDEYVEVLNRVKQHFIFLNIDVLFMLHPLEKSHDVLAEHGFNLVGAACPAEIAFYKFRPKVAAGFNSGALLTVNKIFGVKSISFLGFLPEAKQDSVVLKGELGRVFDSIVEYV